MISFELPLSDPKYILGKDDIIDEPLLDLPNIFGGNEKRDDYDEDFDDSSEDSLKPLPKKKGRKKKGRNEKRKKNKEKSRNIKRKNVDRSPTEIDNVAKNRKLKIHKEKENVRANENSPNMEDEKTSYPPGDKNAPQRRKKKNKGKRRPAPEKGQRKGVYWFLVPSEFGELETEEKQAERRACLKFYNDISKSKERRLVEKQLSTANAQHADDNEVMSDPMQDFIDDQQTIKNHADNQQEPKYTISVRKTIKQRKLANRNEWINRHEAHSCSYHHYQQCSGTDRQNLDFDDQINVSAKWADPRYKMEDDDPKNENITVLDIIIEAARPIPDINHTQFETMGCFSLIQRDNQEKTTNEILYPPTSLVEMLKSKQLFKWIKCTLAEIKSHRKNKSWIRVNDVPAGRYQ